MASPAGSRRFIPTDVGNAASVDCGWGRPPVHPHRRGERVWESAAVVDECGSSPPTWGTRNIVGPGHGSPPVHPHRRGERVGHVAQRLAVPRFIPTDVGNAPRPTRPSRRHAVHPHRRGERAVDAVEEHLGGRFIPTDVGNALPGTPEDQSTFRKAAELPKNLPLATTSNRPFLSIRFPESLVRPQEGRRPA